MTTTPRDQDEKRAREIAEKYVGARQLRGPCAAEIEVLVATARAEERERCIDVVRTEPELPNEPSALHKAAIIIEPVMALRAAVRATKRSIERRLTELPTCRAEEESSNG